MHRRGHRQLESEPDALFDDLVRAICRARLQAVIDSDRADAQTELRADPGNRSGQRERVSSSRHRRKDQVARDELALVHRVAKAAAHRTTYVGHRLVDAHRCRRAQSLTAGSAGGC